MTDQAKKARSEMEANMNVLLDNQEFLEASMKPLAELMHSKLLALIEAGFSREEAMELLKQRGLNA